MWYNCSFNRAIIPHGTGSVLRRIRAILPRERADRTLEELKDVLGTTGTMTVFRKLKALGYLSSYSHWGKYYTLQEIPAGQSRKCDVVSERTLSFISRES